jgi:large subunit ribosomal protein L24
LRNKFISANLSKELRKKYGKRSMPLRKGDVVKITKGHFKKKTGKISIVNRKRLFVEIEGLQIKKKDGSKASVKFRPSILQIMELNVEDRKRIAIKDKQEKETKQEKENAS